MNSAVSYARSVVAGNTAFSWVELEAAAFSSHPPIAQTLRTANAKLSSNVSTGWCAFLIAPASLLFEIWPVIAAGIIVTAGRLGADLTVPTIVAGAGALAFISSRVVLGVGVLRGRADVTATRAGANGVGAVFGVLCVWQTAIAMSDVAAGPVWVVVFVAMTVSAAAVAVALVISFRRSGGVFIPPTPFDDLRREINALPAREQEKIQRDVEDALDLLTTADVIDAETAAGAARAPLGGVARYAWARSQSGLARG